MNRYQIMRRRDALLVVALCATACAGVGAATSYELELVRCVDQARTLEESHACRARTDARWNVMRDGGSDR